MARLRRTMPPGVHGKHNNSNSNAKRKTAFNCGSCPLDKLGIYDKQPPYMTTAANP